MRYTVGGSSLFIRLRNALAVVLVTISGSLLPIACATDPRLGAGIDAAFLPYVEVFERACDCRILDIPITFQIVEPWEAGSCLSYHDLFVTQYEIAIDREWWLTANAEEREILILHELGHCFVHRQHTRKKRDGIPVSVMYPAMGAIPSSWYRTHRQEYLDELFRRASH